MTKTSNPFGRYTKADDTGKQRIIAVSAGEVGTGKTQFWLGAPGPIVIQTLDQGTEGVVEPFTKEKDIYLATYDLGQEEGSEFTHDIAIVACDKFIADFEQAVRHARTIIWDRESDVFPLFSYARSGTQDAFGAFPPKDWDKLKGELRRLIAMAKATDINFGIIQGMKNEWASSVNPKTGKKMSSPTGNRIPAGMDEIDGLVHMVLTHQRLQVNNADGVKETVFSVTCGKSRGPGSRDVQDQTFENITFTDLALMVFPDSDADSWS